MEMVQLVFKNFSQLWEIYLGKVCIKKEGTLQSENMI